MKLYRFSPIRSESELMKALQYLHETSHRLCKEVYGDYLPVRGNIGIFCHDYDEFKYLTELRKNLTSDHPNYKGKYFPLKQPISFREKNGIPSATYEYLYIRQVDPYRSQVGDVDFQTALDGFNAYRQALNTTVFTNGARIFGREVRMLLELFKYIIEEPTKSEQLLHKMKTPSSLQPKVMAGLVF